MVSLQGLYIPLFLKRNNLDTTLTSKESVNVPITGMISILHA